MIEVQVRGGDVEKGIRLLRSLLKKDGIHEEVKHRLNHVKPSEKRRDKMRRAIVRAIKKERRIEALKRKWGDRYDPNYKIGKFVLQA